MRREAAHARTWLFGVIAGLAVVLYGLALLGLGGGIRFPGEATDASPPPHIAHLQEGPPERLGQVEQYSAIAARSLFSSDRSPQEFRLVAEPQQTQAMDVRLTGVLITPRIRMATLQTSSGESLRLRQGAADIGGWRLVSVEPRSAIVEGPGGARNLELQTEGVSRDVGMPGTPSASLPGGVPESTAGGQAAGGNAGNLAAAAPASTSVEAPGTADTTQQRIEAIRQRIEARRQQLQQGQGGTPASNP